MSIVVVKAGIADSIQDLGRYGYQHQGINPTGVMDAVAARLANILVGNNFSEAVIELHFPCSSFLFTQDALCAITGANFTALINEQEIENNKPFIARKGDVLKFVKLISGARCYLAIRNGLAIAKWLNSNSTNTMAGFGGNNYGKFFQKNDEIQFNTTAAYSKALKTDNDRMLSWKIYEKKLYTTNNNIRIIAGNEYNELISESKKIFEKTSFIITPQSNRMAYRMNGTELHLHKNRSLISSAVTKGTIQLLPNGQMIVLMADHQTTGGYPRIGHVISADIATLAQCKPNEKIQFNIITQEAAERELLYQNQLLTEMKEANNLQLNNWLITFNIQ